MEAIYRLNSKDLGVEFVNSVKEAYPDQSIEILVREQSNLQNEDPDWDETEYLLRSPANREHLLKAINDVKEGKNIITFESIEEARKCAEEWAANQR